VWSGSSTGLTQVYQVQYRSRRGSNDFTWANAKVP
jgi:hypothetical protein